MNIVIPMAGAGSRFVDAGFKDPKPLLKAHGKTLLEWSVDSLPLELATRLVFIGLRAHQKTTSIEDLIQQRYKKHNPQFIWLDHVTRGQAETVMMAADLLDKDKGLIIFNIDTAFESRNLVKLLQDPAHDGVLGCFDSSEPRFSFARTDGAGNVLEVKEKVPISNHALTGFYHFAKCADFLQAAKAAIDASRTEKGEFYVAPLYTDLIAKGKRFVLDQVDCHWILGTPDEYRSFLAAPIKPQ